MPKKLHRAKLDVDNIYWGVETINAQDATPADVEVPEDCDLKPGQYKWDAAAGRFEPLAKIKRREKQEDPLIERALYELIKAHPEPPAYSLLWAAWYEKTFDEFGRKKK